MKKYEIPENVRAILASSTKKAGEIVTNYLDRTIPEKCSRIESPIEQLFVVGFECIAVIGRIRRTEDEGAPGLRLVSQFQLGKYRADFMVSAEGLGDRSKKVIVECDGHDFHDRSESERRREKERDRFFQKEGYVVFRYTGAEIVANATGVASEVILVVLGISREDMVNRIMGCA